MSMVFHLRQYVLPDTTISSLESRSHQDVNSVTCSAMTDAELTGPFHLETINQPEKSIQDTADLHSAQFTSPCDSVGSRLNVSDEKLSSVSISFSESIPAQCHPPSASDQSQFLPNMTPQWGYH